MIHYVDHFSKFKSTSGVSTKLIGIVGWLIGLGGIALQVKLTPLCATPCPEHCPLPAPHFNHNALFHLIMAMSALVVTYSVTTICHSIDIDEHDDLVKNLDDSVEENNSRTKIIFGYCEKKIMRCEKNQTKSSFCQILCIRSQLTRNSSPDMPPSRMARSTKMVLTTCSRALATRKLEWFRWSIVSGSLAIRLQSWSRSLFASS